MATNEFDKGMKGIAAGFHVALIFTGCISLSGLAYWGLVNAIA